VAGLPYGPLGWDDGYQFHAFWWTHPKLATTPKIEPSMTLNDSGPPLCQYPFGPAPLSHWAVRSTYWPGVTIVELLVETIALRATTNVLALTSPSPRAKEHQWGFALCALWVFLPSHSWAAIRASSPAAFARDTFQAHFRSLPTLVYSIGGVTDAGGVGGDGYRLSAFSNAGAARTGIEGLTKSVLSTKIFVLLRAQCGHRHSCYLCFRYGRSYLVRSKPLSL
jgi:hypothetical protein